ncbi:ATP-binding protein [Radiobacillus kanasensis]|uniref:ATP-binding protein n=1 Tax=Radiobacillus kanasensis TaxID=2844358 RepID=UPI001E31DD8F|nr:ATP-binding protein [Radiobacillus kanasensis]UFU00174.1 ATP-binding protein [Radiobacillus kanasensis]
MNNEKLDNDFLPPGIEQLRTQIKGIDQSYNNNWDILAELCQNSVDAIRKSNVNVGKIHIEINSQQRSIMVQDNGIGINPKDLPVLLKPFSTNKGNDETTIGEKGVGLTFAMFSCNDFHIKTGNQNGSIYGSVQNAFSWKNSVDNSNLPLNYSAIEEELQGTEITLKDVDKNCPIFKLRYEQVKFVLRTKTAIGSTKAIFSSDKDIEVTLSFIDQDGLVYPIEKIPFKYWLITEGLESLSLDVNTYYEFRKDKSDSEKRKKLLGKIIYKKGEFVHNDQRIIKYIVCFAPTRKTWKKVSNTLNLCTEDQLNNEEWLESFDYTLFNSGIYTSVKGMPTGISVDNPNTGASGYWYNLFILFEDSKLSFDIGRKSIYGSQARIYKEYSKMLFNEFYREIIKYIPEVDPEPGSQWNRDQAFAELDSLPNLDINGINFKKSPKDQEAGVVGLFFESIGKGIIKDIYPLCLGYKKKYDLFAHIQDNIRTIIEFKSKVRYILNDFKSYKKMFDEIDCIVCWDVSEDDIEAIQKEGLRIEEVEENNILVDLEYKYPNSTHELVFSGYHKPIYIIDLKKVLKG